MPIRSALTFACLLAGTSSAVGLPRPSHAASGPTIRFQATIGGAIRTSGSVSSAETVLQQRPPEFNGCAIIKHKYTELGAYSLEIRINRGSFFLGGWEQGALDLSIDNYQPNESTYKSPNIGGKFAFRGQSYGASVINSTVQVRGGGASGTYTDRQAHHLVPGTADAFTKAGTLTINASWHCATVFHLSDT